MIHYNFYIVKLSENQSLFPHVPNEQMRYAGSCVEVRVPLVYGKTIEEVTSLLKQAVLKRFRLHYVTNNVRIPLTAGKREKKQFLERVDKSMKGDLHVVALGVETTLKIHIHNTLIDEGMTKIELAHQVVAKPATFENFMRALAFRKDASVVGKRCRRAALAALSKTIRITVEVS